MSEQLYALPATWTWATVQDVIVDAQSGFASGKKNVRGGIRHLRMNNISKNCTLDLSSVVTVPKDLARPAYILKPGDVLFCHTNSVKLVGKTALFDRADLPYAFSNHLTRLRIPAEGPPSEWIWYWLATLWRQRYFETRCKQWVNQATVERGTLLSTPIPVAPLREQRRIVAHVTKIIERNRTARNRLLKLPMITNQFRQSVLAKVFHGGLIERDPKDKPAEKLLEKITEEDRGESQEGTRAKGKVSRRFKNERFRSEALPHLPQGWFLVRLRQLLREPLRNGKSALPSGSSSGIPVLRLSAVTFKDFGPSNIKLCALDEEDVKDLWVQPHDILVARSNTREYVGMAAVYEGRGGQFIFPDLMIRVRVDEEIILPEFLALFLDSAFARDYFRELAGGTAGSMPKISQTDIENLPVPLTSLKEQKQIVKKVQDMFRKVVVVEQAVQEGMMEATTLEHSTLTQAFRGELLSQDPNDEPASVLMERLRTQQATMIKKPYAQAILSSGCSKLPSLQKRRKRVT